MNFPKCRIWTRLIAAILLLVLLCSSTVLNPSSASDAKAAVLSASADIDWAVLTSLRIAPRRLTTVWASSPTDIFVGGGYPSGAYLAHYDGSNWTTQIEGGVQTIREIWGTGPNDVFAVGGQPGRILHYDGTSWQIQYSGHSLDDIFSVWGSSSTDVFAVALNSSNGHGKIFHYDGIAWTQQYETSTNVEGFFTVWGSSSTDVFAGGFNGYSGLPGAIYHYDGSEWTKQLTGVNYPHGIESIWGTSATDVFAVGGPGIILHYDGTAWSQQQSLTTRSLYSIWGSSPTDVYVVGCQGIDGEILHYEGSTWNTMPIGAESCLTGIWGLDSGELFTFEELGLQRIFMGTPSSIPPTIDSIAGPLEPVNIGDQPVSVEVFFSDPDAGDSHDVTWDWGDGSDNDTQTDAVSPASKGHIYAEAGVYPVTTTVVDGDGNSARAIYEYIVIYDPVGGFVTGGGWIDSPEGAYTADPALTGKANFGFVSKYKKGATFPTGNTEFNFKTGDLNFHSYSYDWLVVAGAKAMYRGVGTINGQGSYGFMLSAVDAALTPSTDADLFRIKIWDKDNGDEIVYDNQIGDADDADPTTAIGGGNIVVHSDKVSASTTDLGNEEADGNLTGPLFLPVISR